MNITTNCMECSKPLDPNKRQYGGLCSIMCESSFNVKMKTPTTYFKFWPESLDEKCACTVESHELAGCLEDADEAYLVKPITMTKAEFLSLPEFTGF